jgi:hypothetical protein
MIPPLREIKAWLDSQKLKPLEHAKVSLMLLTMKKRFDNLTYENLCQFLPMIEKMKETVQSGQFPPQVIALMNDKDALSILKDYNSAEIQAALKEVGPYVVKILDALIRAFKSAKTQIETERAEVIVTK